MIGAGNVCFNLTVINSDRERSRLEQRSEIITTPNAVLRFIRHYREIHDPLKYRGVMGEFLPSSAAITCI